MTESEDNPDRKIIEESEAIWSDDPELTLTEDEVNRVLGDFPKSEDVDRSELGCLIQTHFERFMIMAKKERIDGLVPNSNKAQKPTTVVNQDMERMKKACIKFLEQLCQLRPATKTWIDQHLEEIGANDGNGGRVRLRDLESQIQWPLDQLIHAAHSSENLASRGPSNVAQRSMIEKLSELWEYCDGKPPTTDKARGLRNDPFLKTCQAMSSFAQARLAEKRASFATLELSGLVDDVLKKKRTGSGKSRQEK